MSRDVFVHEGLAYVKEVNDLTGKGPDGEPKLKSAEGMAEVPADLIEVVIEVVEECSGECIFIEK